MRAGSTRRTTRLSVLFDVQIGQSKTISFSNGTNLSRGLTGSGVTGAAVRATDGGSGVGAILAGVLVEANTAGSGAPNVIAANESGTVFTNEGVTAKNYHTPVTAAAGYQFTFIVQDADGLRVVANTSDTIRIGATVSSAAGYCESTTIGDSVTIVAINAVEWVATSLIGSGWTCALLFPAFGVRKRLRHLLAATDRKAA